MTTEDIKFKGQILVLLLLDLSVVFVTADDSFLAKFSSLGFWDTTLS